MCSWCEVQDNVCKQVTIFSLAEKVAYFFKAVNKYRCRDGKLTQMRITFDTQVKTVLLIDCDVSLKCPATRDVRMTRSGSLAWQDFP